MFFFLVESRFSPVRVSSHAAVRASVTRGFRISTRPGVKEDADVSAK
jgi:hypothetical protein